MPLYEPAGIATDLNISGQSENDLLYFNGTNWARVPISPADPGNSSLALRSGSPSTDTGPYWIDNRFVGSTATADTSTTSTTYVTMDSMSFALTAAGIYFVIFTASGACSSATANAVYAIHLDGTIIAESERSMNDTGGAATASMFTGMCIASVALLFSPGTIDIRYKTEAGTFTVRERSVWIQRMV